MDMEEKCRRFNESWEMPRIEHLVPTKWGWMVAYPDNLELHHNTDIGAFTFINANEGVIIEEGVQIGSHCAIHSYSTINNKRGKVILRAWCKIGSHTTIMPGVEIGEQAVIGAGSYIDFNVKPFTKIIPQIKRKMIQL